MKKQFIIECIIALFLWTGRAAAADFYVSSSGSAAGDGSLADPWDLETALHHPPALQPGDTIWVRGGTYSGAHTSLLAGTEANPITVRAYRRERVILDYADNNNCNPGETDECSPNNKRCNALTIPSCSHDVVLRDLEFTNSSPSGRISVPAGGCTNAPECCYVNGVAPPLKPECSATPAAIARAQWQPLHVAGDRVKIVNVTVHDGGIGITTDQKALDTEIYGALVFNNGWVDPAAGQGPGLQIENVSPSWRRSAKSVRNSVVWNNFGAGYSGPTAWGRFSTDIHLDDIVAFNNGAPSAAFYGGSPAIYDQVQNIRYGNIMVQSEETMHFVELNRCRLYQPAGSVVEKQHFGGIKSANYEFHKDIIIEDSYLASTGTPLSLIRWQRVRTTGTTVVGGATAAVGDSEALVEMEKTECSSLWAPNSPWNPLDMEGNHYFFTGAGAQPFGVNTSGAWSYKTFAQWRTAISNRDATSTYATGSPTTNAVFVHPNAYEAGRAHIAVYNWQGLNSVGVDLSSAGLSAGQGFRIYNLQAFDDAAVSDPFGSVVASGNYNPAQPIVSVAMTDTSVTAPIGLGTAVASTLPQFGAFLVRSTPCGDGSLDVGEVCDDGNSINGDGCDSNCTVSACGNGATGAPEECDDGNAINSDACKNDCTANVCGDGTVRNGVEACDDGNGTNGDGCDNNCTVSVCGNGIVAGSEVCDDGNGTNGDGCDNNCTVTACGNTIVSAPEICDDGNAVNGDGCDNNCSVTACGNGIAAGSEVCDDGNGTNGDGCDNNCTVTACGNTIVSAPEICDDGNAINGDGCDTNCTVTACGNGIASVGEVCDDGNATNGDGCDNNCTLTACGNGIRTGIEGCDDGNPTNGDGCDNNCTATACGNGIRTGSEGCDDGNTVAADGCENNCSYTPISEMIGPDGRIGTDPLNEGASEQRPIQLELFSPNDGNASIAPSTEAPTEGFAVVGVELQITAPPATATAPLQLSIDVDASLIPPDVDATRLGVLRNGAEVKDCDGAPDTASPDPCIKSRLVLMDGDVRLSILTSHASLWSVVIRALSGGEQGCVNGMNASGVKVAKAQGNAALSCLKATAKGDEANAQACLTSDAGGKIAAAVAKSSAVAADKCAVTPPFGFTGVATVNSTPQQQVLALVADVMGANLTSSALLNDTDEPGAKCQGIVLKGVVKLFESEAKQFLKCKKKGLAGKTSVMVTAADLGDCFDELAADSSGKIAKAIGKLADSLAKGCSGANIATLFPSACANRGDVAACLEEQAACRICRMFASMDGVNEDCDRFDDGQANSSCN